MKDAGELTRIDIGEDSYFEIRFNLCTSPVRPELLAVDGLL